MKLPMTMALFSAAFAVSLGHASAAQIISNGTFDAGLTGWTKSDMTGSDGTFSVQTGTVSPLSGASVPAPPGSPNAAMTDGQGPGTHIIYQDFTVPGPVGSAVLSFSLFVGNQAGTSYAPSPATLNFGVAAFSQQARVDILLSSSDTFSVSSSDVLLNVFQTGSGSSTAPSAYANYSFQIASLLNANANRTLRLRFAEVDNVAPFQLGVDNVSLETSAVPEPASFATAGIGVLGVVVLWKCRHRRIRRS